MARRLPPPMEFPIEDLAGFGFLDNVLDPEMLREAVQLGIGGAGAAVTYSLIVENVRLAKRHKDGKVIKDEKDQTVKERWFNKPWKRILLAGVVGVGGGALGWRYGKRELARGVMASMAGVMGVEIKGAIQQGLQKCDGAVDGTDYDAEAALNAFFATPEEQDLLNAPPMDVEQLSSAFTRRQNGQAVGDVEVEDEDQLSDVGQWVT